VEHVQLGDDIFGESITVAAALHLHAQASYVLRACDGEDCVDAPPVVVTGSLADVVGYVKASNPGNNDRFGHQLALSGDGNTLAIGAYFEDSSATGIGGNQANNAATNSGAVYVFVRLGIGMWVQQAYVKASNPGANDYFGESLALSADGSTLVVGAYLEDSIATGIGGNQASEASTNAGAVYVFVRDGLGAWSQQAYIKASNTTTMDFFGESLALSADGDTLAVGAPLEDSSATGIGGNQASQLAQDSGAVYVFVRDALGTWTQEAYVKANNTNTQDRFGWRVTLSGDGDTLAVGAVDEDSGATGVGGDWVDNFTSNAGAVYVLVRSGAGAWAQQAYVKATNTDSGDEFGESVALSGDGDTLAVGTVAEDGAATGIDGDQANDSASAAGAVYVYVRNDLGAWSPQAYVKATNTAASDFFGADVALSAAGDVLAVGAIGEDGAAIGIDGNDADDSASLAGAAYVLVRDELGEWSHWSYVKASNTDVNDSFGGCVALSEDGQTLVVGAYAEDGSGTGIGGDPSSNTLSGAGAVYLY